MSMAAGTPLLAIKSKEGELDALKHTRGTDSPVQVMVELLNGTAPGGSISQKIVEAGVEAAVADNPLWVDTTWLTANSAFGTSPHVALEHFDQDIEHTITDMLGDFNKPCLIPVISSRADQQHLHAIRMLLEHQDRPVVIRAQHPSSIASDLPQEIERIAAALHREPEALRIVFDEGYVKAVEQHRVNALAQSISKVLTAGFTEIRLLSGSTPPKRTNFETHIRPRAEVQLWEAVRQTYDHDLGYGDYGVVHPIPPTPEGPIFGPNPYIHYTVPGATLSIARQIPGRKGAPPPGSSERYFLEVADELVRRPEFVGPKFSWGDRILHSCKSKPAMRLGKSTKWISIATSHHLAHLAKRLDSPTS